MGNFSPPWARVWQRREGMKESLHCYTFTRLLRYLIRAFPNYYPVVLVLSILLPMPFCFPIYSPYASHHSICHCCFSMSVCKVTDKTDCFLRTTNWFGDKIYRVLADHNKLLINCFLFLMSVNTEPDAADAEREEVEGAPWGLLQTSLWEENTPLQETEQTSSSQGDSPPVLQGSRQRIRVGIPRKFLWICICQISIRKKGSSTVLAIQVSLFLHVSHWPDFSVSACSANNVTLV